MRAVIARIFDYSLDGIVADEGTSFFDFCRILPDDPIQIAYERDFFTCLPPNQPGSQPMIS